MENAAEYDEWFDSATILDELEGDKTQQSVFIKQLKKNHRQLNLEK
jgi:hypothetical protein